MQKGKELTEDFDFAKDSACVSYVIKGILDLFDCNFFFRLMIFCGKDNAICSAADHMSGFIAFINDYLLTTYFKLVFAFHSGRI